MLDNNTAWDYARDFGVYSPAYVAGSANNNTLRNNTWFANKIYVKVKKDATQATNSWNLDIECPQAKGTNPDSPEFLSLSANSPAINAAGSFVPNLGLPPYKRVEHIRLSN